MNLRVRLRVKTCEEISRFTHTTNVREKLRGRYQKDSNKHREPPLMFTIFVYKFHSIFTLEIAIDHSNSISSLFMVAQLDFQDDTRLTLNG